jgi:hypothetical protein
MTLIRNLVNRSFRRSTAVTSLANRRAVVSSGYLSPVSQ